MSCKTIKMSFSQILIVLAFDIAVASMTPGSFSVLADNFAFIDTSIENASPLDWDVRDDETIQVNLRYDHERNAPNRAAGHWHFRIEAVPGSTVSIALNRFFNVWNGRQGLPVGEKTITYLSEDGNQWTSMETDFVEESGEIRFSVTIPESGNLFVARLPPYRISDLNALIDEVANHPCVNVKKIGETVQGRPLEIIRVGNSDAPNRVFIRARAHPWESGGNWVVDGMIRHLMISEADEEYHSAKRPNYFDRFCVYIMPMANKDGVATGMTRFNLRGKDLNRDWNAPADAALCPENAALEQWLESMLEVGKRPHLALEMHNDQNGKLHISRTPNTDLTKYLTNMRRLESLMREKSWFREGSTKPSFTNAGTLGEGWLSRYGIDAVVHELNCQWIEGLKQRPSKKNWQLYGRQLCDVFYAYFEKTP